MGLNSKMPGFNIPIIRPDCAGFVGGIEGNAIPATLETSRVHRYALTIFEPLENVLIFSHKCNRPSPEIDRITMHHGQDEIYWPGKNRWNPIEISFYEGHLSPNCDTVADKIFEWWSSNVVDINNSRIVPLFKRDCTLDLLNGGIDGGLVAVHRYRMLGCWPSKVTPTSLTYSESDIAEITVKLEMDKCLEEKNPNCGQQALNIAFAANPFDKGQGPETDTAILGKRLGIPLIPQQG